MVEPRHDDLVQLEGLRQRAGAAGGALGLLVARAPALAPAATVVVVIVVVVVVVGLLDSVAVHVSGLQESRRR